MGARDVQAQVVLCCREGLAPREACVMQGVAERRSGQALFGFTSATSGDAPQLGLIT